jgi:hypothetical protein
LLDGFGLLDDFVLLYEGLLVENAKGLLEPFCKHLGRVRLRLDTGMDVDCYHNREHTQNLLLLCSYNFRRWVVTYIISMKSLSLVLVLRIRACKSCRQWKRLSAIQSCR